ncbi:hypothetical protein NON00_00815, partial [Roseomonas sp. GC11]|nr:hypothetical protein [Roseomonas sp. GC11]
MARHGLGYGLRFWAAISAALHVLIGLLLLLRMPGKELPVPQEAVPVELVTPDMPQLAQAPSPLPLPAPPAPTPTPNPSPNPSSEPAKPTPPTPPPPPPPPPP